MARLVLDKRKQRADYNGHPCGEHRGELVAEALPPARWEQHEGVFVVEERIDRLSLLGAEGGMTEDGLVSEGKRISAARRVGGTLGGGELKLLPAHLNEEGDGGRGRASKRDEGGGGRGGSMGE